MRSKARITITLPPQLLGQIDGIIDGETIRNRSHAIEHLVRRSLEPQVTTAAILAGGRVGRETFPALLSINGTTLINITLAHLATHGIETIYILAGDSQEQLRQLLGNGGSFGVSLRYIREDRPRGTLGAVKLIEEEIGSAPLLVMHGDVLTDIDLTEFFRFHKREGTLATVAVKPRQAERKYGKVMMQGNRITEFLDTSQSEGISIINTGVYLLQPEALRLVTADALAHFEVDLFPRLAELGELSAFLFQGIWFDISEGESYRLARERWASK
jgi:NDP-sugar pyrophosphorylase family protein